MKLKTQSPKNLQTLKNKKMNDIVKKDITKFKQSILNIAASQLGKSEQPKGSNWGEDVQGYLKSVNIDFPAPWCAAFVNWCVQKACKEAGIKCELPCTGGVLDLRDKVRQRINNKTIQGISIAKLPMIGDIFIMQFAHGTGHTGFVKDIQGDFIKTIEGNSNDDGSREGYEVCEHHRPIATINCFIRIIL